jgi:hypothetical protein
MYADIWNRWFHSGDDISWDSTDLLAYLNVRQRSHGLGYSSANDDQGCLSRVMWEMSGARDVWTQAPAGSRAIIMDTTWATNTHGLKLCMLVSVDNEGHTRILSVALIEKQGEEDFVWIHDTFVEIFGSSPDIVFSDEDPAIHASIVSAFASSCKTVLHLLCTFHIYKNFHKWVRGKYSGDDSGWRSIVNRFWRFAKYSDNRWRSGWKEHVGYEEQEQWNPSWESEWDEFTEEILEKCRSAEQYTKVQDFLERLKGKRERWAACWTWQHTTIGVHSTQRIEGLHKHVKTFLTNKTTLKDLSSHLQDFVEEGDMKRGVLITRARNISVNAAFIMHVLTVIHGVFSTFCWSLLVEQSRQAVQYSYCWVGREEREGRNALDWFCVWRNRSPNGGNAVNDQSQRDLADHGMAGGYSSKLQTRLVSVEHCSCQFSSCWGGLPCRHQLRLYLVLNLMSLVCQPIEFWKKAKGSSMVASSVVAPSAGEKRKQDAMQQLDTGYSKTERRELMSAEFADVLEVAQYTDADMEYVRFEIKRMHERIKLPMLARSAPGQSDEKQVQKEGRSEPHVRNPVNAQKKGKGRRQHARKKGIGGVG